MLQLMPTQLKWKLNTTLTFMQQSSTLHEGTYKINRLICIKHTFCTQRRVAMNAEWNRNANVQGHEHLTRQLLHSSMYYVVYEHIFMQRKNGMMARSAKNIAESIENAEEYWLNQFVVLFRRAGGRWTVTVSILFRINLNIYCSFIICR